MTEKKEMPVKERQSILYVGGILLLLFIGVSIFTFYKSNQMIERGYLTAEGTAAKDFAILAAANIHLTNEQVTTLKQLSYEDLLTSRENQTLESMLSNEYFDDRIDYAYVMVHLKQNEIRYKVDEKNKNIFDAPIGTKLDIMWLLDVTISENDPLFSDEDPVDDLERYGYYIPEDASIFSEIPTYIYNSSEWGDHICGYAPLYSEEGTYIGAVGIELKTTDFDSYRENAMWAMGLLLIISTLLLVLLFLSLYLKYRTIQHDKIYTDALTHLYNRSYYNNQFIRKMNGLHSREPYFALMIADIDWFKKVNDTFGHEVGDQVLIEVSEVLLSHFGKAHVTRFGGEEFVIGLWFNRREELVQILDRFYQEVRTRKFSTQELNLTLSLGCCFTSHQELNGWLTSSMLRAADCSLYQIKENGRNQYQIEEFDASKVYEKKSKDPSDSASKPDAK